MWTTPAMPKIQTIKRMMPTTIRPSYFVEYEEMERKEKTG